MLNMHMLGAGDYAADDQQQLLTRVLEREFSLIISAWAGAAQQG
jgi:hypothetical protein